MILTARRSVSLLLTAAMLSGTANPVAMRHSHSGGERPHRHADDRAEQVHRRDHHHHHGHHRHGHDAGHVPHESGGSAPEHLQSNTEHLHLVWFGIEFTWPRPLGNSQEDEPAERSVAFIRLNSNEATISSQPGNSIESLARPSHFRGSLVANGATDAISTPTDVPARTLLCDIARRERSGVLLT